MDITWCIVNSIVIFIRLCWHTWNRIPLLTLFTDTYVIAHILNIAIFFFRQCRHGLPISWTIEVPFSQLWVAQNSSWDGWEMQIGGSKWNSFSKMSAAQLLLHDRALPVSPTHLSTKVRRIFLILRHSQRRPTLQRKKWWCIWVRQMIFRFCMTLST